MCIETALESTVSPRLVVLRGDRGAMLYRVFITGRWDEDEAVGRRYGTAGQKASNTVIALGDALLRSLGSLLCGQVRSPAGLQLEG